MRTFLLVIFFGCSGGKADPDGGVGGDADTDADADSDSDSDTDADSDTDSGTEPTTDLDGDGFGPPADCDDTDPAVYPGAPDRCGDGRVTDCDRTSDDGLVTLDGAVGYDSLQDALDAASEGSELLLCPGTYDGRFVASVPVTLTALEDAATTTLAGHGDSTILVPGGSSLVGLTIRGGETTGVGGGVRMTTAGSLLLDGCVVTENTADSGGGVYVAADSAATLVDTVVSANTALLGGGGVAVGAGGTLDLSAGSTVEGNTATYFGGGVLVTDGHLVGGVVSGNSVSVVVWVYPFFGSTGLYYYGGAWNGSGVALVGVSDLSGTEVVLNTGGAGVSASSGAATVADASIHDNDGYYGGGISVVSATLDLVGTSTVTTNHGYFGGGGIVVAGSVSGGSYTDNVAYKYGGGLILYNADLSGALIQRNATDVYGDGGGVYVVGQSAISTTTIADNTASVNGGGVATNQQYSSEINSLSITGSLISGNTAEQGGGIYSIYELVLTDTEVADNTADAGGGLFLTTFFDPSSGWVYGGRMVRNTAAGPDAGGAVRVEQAARLEVFGTDLGEGVDDNAPADVRVGVAEDDYSYGVGATFSCDASGCSP